MRTKTVLLTALLGAASIASSVAQTVYSVNAVGYVNVQIPANGFALLANPLKQPTNSLNAVLPDVPAGTKAYVISGGQFVPYTKVATKWTGASVDAVRLDPGTGFFLKNPSNSVLTVTFVGEVPQTTDTEALTIAYNAGYNLIGSKVPQTGGLESTLGYTGVAGDVVYTFSAEKQAYDKSTRIATKWTGPGVPTGGTEPSISVAQGFWLNAKNSGTWTRNFTIGQ